MNRTNRLWPLGLSVILAQFCFVAFYLSREHAIHFWDYAMYANMALMAWSQPDIVGLLSLFFQSFSNTYNLLYAIPSFFSFSLFAPTRDVFILTNHLVYFVPHQIAIGFVLSRIFPIDFRRAAVWSFVLCPLVPFMWYPLLEGYPDNAAAAAMTFALGFILMKERGWKQGLLIGGLLGLSIVLRRHYAYPALVLVCLSGMTDLWNYARNRAKPFMDFVQDTGVFYACVGAAVIALMVVLEPNYLQEILTTDFQKLYKSYERPADYFLLFALSRIGLVGLLAVLSGYLLAAQRAPKSFQNLTFVFLAGILWMAVWAFGPAQAGEHYLISILPVFCVVGLFSLLRFTISSQFQQIDSWLAFLFLSLNSYYALFFGPFIPPSEPPSLSLTSTPRPPWVREDYSELTRLADYVRNTTTDRDRIAIVGSSFYFNQDLVRALYTDVLKDVAPALRFVFAPESDGQQEPPLETYLKANVFLVATPTQYHLDPAGQQVVTALASRFPPPKELSASFSLDPQSFRLGNGAKVEIWRKGRLTPLQMHEELSQIRDYKHSEQYWINERAEGRTQAISNQESGDILIVQHQGGKRFSSFYYDKPVSAGYYRLDLDTESMGRCRSLIVTVDIKASTGAVIDSKPAKITSSAGKYYFPLSIDQTITPAFLSLRVETETPDFCTVALKQLQLKHLQ